MESGRGAHHALSLGPSLPGVRGVFEIPGPVIRRFDVSCPDVHPSRSPFFFRAVMRLLVLLDEAHLSQRREC
jgi:hypothetical protein